MNMEDVMKKNSNAMNCKCGNQWLEEIRVSKFNGDMVVALGQTLQKVAESFVIYKCPVCEDFTLPRTHLTTQDSLRKEYDDMYDSLTDGMEATKDERHESE